MWRQHLHHSQGEKPQTHQDNEKVDVNEKLKISLEEDVELKNSSQLLGNIHSGSILSSLQDDFEDMMNEQEDSIQAHSNQQKKLIDYPDNHSFTQNYSFEQFQSSLPNEYLQSQPQEQQNGTSSFSSSETLATDKPSSINYKKIPECSFDILPIIQRIHLNHHLLAFFVKYQRHFSSLQYYGLLLKLKQNVDDIKDIKLFETAKHEEKLKILQEKNPSAKMKYDLEFLDTEATKKHFGYIILLRNISQKLAFYDPRKSIQIMRVLASFDKNLGMEFYDLIWQNFSSMKEKFSVFDLISYQFLLANKNEQNKSNVNFSQQAEITHEMLKRDLNEFTSPVLIQLIKLRIMYPIYTIQETNLVIAKCQKQILAQLDAFNLKHLLEIMMVCLTNGIHMEKNFVQTIFKILAEKLPFQQNVKSKVIVQILRFFRKQQLFYLQRVNPNDPSNLGFGSSGRDVNDDNENEEDLEQTQGMSMQQQQQSGFQDKSDSSNKGEGVRAVCEIENLFQVLLKAVLKDLNNGSSLKPYSLYLLLKIAIRNDVKDPAVFGTALREFSKATSRASFLMFAKTYQVLSDYAIITPQIHQLTLPKIKTGVLVEQKSYLKMHQLIHQNDSFDVTHTEQENIANVSKSFDETTSQVKQADVEEKTIQHDDDGSVLQNNSKNIASLQQKNQERIEEVNAQAEVSSDIKLQNQPKDGVTTKTGENSSSMDASSINQDVQIQSGISSSLSSQSSSPLQDQHQSSEQLQQQSSDLETSEPSKTLPSKIRLNPNQLTLLLLVKLNFCVSNLWSYVLNSLKFSTDTECDLVLFQTSIAYANLLIDDIISVLKNQGSVTIMLIQQAQHINNFIETQQLSKEVPYLEIAKLVGNRLIEIVDTNNALNYSTKTELLFLLQKRYFLIKYGPFIEKNALVRELIFDLKLTLMKKNEKNSRDSNSEKDSSAMTSQCFLANYASISSVNYEGKERGLQFLNKHFAIRKQVGFTTVSYFEFIEFLRTQKQAKMQILPNFLETKLGIIPQEFNVPISEQVQTTLQLFDEQIALLFQESIKELDAAVVQTTSKSKNSNGQQYQQKNSVVFSRRYVQ